jgi:exosortase family protein XrtM
VKAREPKEELGEMPVQNTSGQNSLQGTVQSYGREIRFLVIFVLTLAMLNFVYFLCGGTSVENFVLATMTAKPVFAIIQLLTPSEQAVLNGTLLTSPSVYFEIVRGCEGMEGMLLMISAICAFSISWSDKLKGILLGVAFIYAFNLLRIVGLYYLMTYNVSLFNFVHLYIGQSITIILVSVFFILWISRSLKKDENKPTG